MEKIRYSHKWSPFKSKAAVAKFDLLKPCRRFLIFIPLCLFLFSCDQHAIFFDISREVKPKEPYIPGSPTKIVTGGTSLYVSNGKSLYHNPGSGWAPMDKPAGTISDVAAAGSTLYCIIENSRLYRNTGSSWEQVPVPGYTYLQNIYGTSGSLYICASTAGSTANVYTILSYSGTLRSVMSGSGEGYFLRGAAGNYIATTGGIFNAGSSTPISGSTGHTIMGIIALPGGGIAASTKDGYILHGSGSVTASSLGLSFDRAMAVYKTTKGYLLLVGVHTKGFVEIELSGNGSWPNYSSYHYPGEGTYGVNTTAHDYAQYRSSLGIQSLTALYQQGQNGPLFASTQQKGLWAYQYGDEGWQWNAY
ncbi:MAG: hypothetical protein LBP71_06700 [Spirochaetaceae bacterium]|jgi:hypothetical protein|nr:hypothetical protein [Spirochaetaceae bacterium]